MKVAVGRGDVSKEKACAVLCTERATPPSGLPESWRTAIQAARKAGAFTGERGKSAEVYPGGARVQLVGLGKAADVDEEGLRRAGAAAASAARKAERASVAVWLTDDVTADFNGGRALAEGVVLGSYVTPKQSKERPAKAPSKASLHLDGKALAPFRKGVECGGWSARGQVLARDLGNGPGNVITPTAMAAQARKLAAGGKLRCKIVKKPELVKKGYGGLLGVNRGSDEAPVFIELEHKPAKPKKTVCLIGKGLTFDTGGISLKPSAGMEEMKFDMCGGAAVLGAMAAVAEWQPSHVRVIALVPSTDNMPGPTAIKPGDVLKSYGGTTIEVINTDAEGRLILADALGRAQEFKPDYTIDLATLTGACVMALGHRATGLFSASDDLRERLVAASEQTMERAWPLPHWEEYGEDIKSTVADVKNLGPRWGGAITAYAFLRKFAGELTWAHMDIAGTAWDMPKREYYEGGATGTGVRTLVRFLENLS